MSSHGSGRSGGLSPQPGVGLPPALSSLTSFEPWIPNLYRTHTDSDKVELLWYDSTFPAIKAILSRNIDTMNDWIPLALGQGHEAGVVHPGTLRLIMFRLRGTIKTVPGDWSNVAL